MSDKNIQIRHKENGQWGNLYPHTLTENIFNEKGDQEIMDARNGEPSLKQRLDKDRTFLEDHLTKIGDDLERAFTIIDTSMSREKVQTLLNEGGQFIFSEGEYKYDLPSGYDPEVFDIKSDTHIIFDKKAKITISEHDALRYKFFYVKDQKNITFENITIDGARDKNASTTGEWGMGFSIVGSDNITIRNALVKNCWGDGIYIGRYGSQSNKSTNIILDNVVCDNNRRQGISVVSVDGLYGRNVTLKNTNGTAPEAGIDFEPNNPDEELTNIYFDGLKVLNNNGNGIMFYLPNFSDKYRLNATFNQVEAIGNKQAGISLLKFNGTAEGIVKFKDPYIKNSGTNSIYVRGISKNFSRMIFENPVIINNNTTNTGGITQGSAVTILRASPDFPEDPNFKMGNLEVRNPQFITESGFTKYSKDISVDNQVDTGMDIFEDIKLTGLEAATTNNLSILNDTNEIEDTKTSKFAYWPGTTPVTQNFPQSDRIIKEVGFTTKNCIAQLQQAGRTDIAQEITFKVDTRAHYKQTVRPPDGEHLFPRSLTSKTTGRGVTTSSDGNENIGSSLTVKRIDGNWHIINMLGNWSAEN